MTFKEFAQNHNLILNCTHINTFETNKDLKAQFKFDCTLINGNKSMNFDYSMGYGHRLDLKGNQYQFTNRLTIYEHEKRLLYYKAPKPTIEDVLYSLVMDAQAGTYSFNVFCDEFGYNNDSIKVQNIYFACQKIRDDLSTLLSITAYNELMNCEEA